MLEPGELLAYYPENSRTRVLEYTVTYLTLQRHDDILGGFFDFPIEIAYTVHNGRLILARPPNLLPRFDYFRIGDYTDRLIISAGHDGIYLAHLDGENSSVQCLWGHDIRQQQFEQYFDRESIKNLVFAQLLSVSPDGRYVLFESNRNYMDDALTTNFELFAIDLRGGNMPQALNHTRIMDFNNMEILTWDRYNPDSFLFRESRIAPDGTRYSSPIMRYSLGGGGQSVFLDVGERYRAYQMVDDEHIYIFRRETDEETGHVTTGLYVANIYTHEMFSVDTGIYSNVWDVRLSDTGEYIAFWASYMNQVGWVLVDLVTVHIPTNDLMPQYEQSVDNFFIHSFYWAPGNILITNFINTTELYRDLSRFHRITHTGRAGEPRAGSADSLVR